MAIDNRTESYRSTTNAADGGVEFDAASSRANRRQAVNRVQVRMCRPGDCPGCRQLETVDDMWRMGGTHLDYMLPANF